MLGNIDEATIDQRWDSLPSQAVLPVSWEEFSSYTGKMPQDFDCQRMFRRHYLRCKAILEREGVQHAIYLKDCSRTGMGIVSPVQLFPCERVLFWKETDRNYQIEITRCRKISPLHYECGSVFVLN